MMGGLDFKFDPATKDLIDAPDGSWVETGTAETAVWIQLESELGAWWGDADAGSRLHDLRSFQSDPVALLADEARRALGVLVQEGLIADVNVRVEDAGYGRVNVATRCRDLSSGSLLDSFVKAGR